MIPYTVLWREDLINELAELWMTYYDRRRITAAVDRIEKDLSTDAHVRSDYFSLGKRSISRGPLTAFFRVDEGDRKVTVEDIWLTELN